MKDFSFDRQKKISKLNWFDADGLCYDFSQIISKLKKYSKFSKIYIGSDSHRKGDLYIFSTAICVHNDKIGKYYYVKYRMQKNKFFNIKDRLMFEAFKTINLGLELREEYGLGEIELHFDINKNKKFKSNVVAESVKNYTKSLNFMHELKPDCWAANCIADSHAR